MTDHGSSHPPHLGYEGYPTAHADHGVAKYIYVFLALCLLTMCSFLTYTDLWRSHLPIGVGRFFMMAVSCAKAGLVICFFMHLKYEADWKYVLTIPASIMSIFLVLALVPDVGLRVRTYSTERQENVATEKDTEDLVTVSAAEQNEEHGGHDHAAPPASPPHKH